MGIQWASHYTIEITATRLLRARKTPLFPRTNMPTVCALEYITQIRDTVYSVARLKYEIRRIICARTHSAHIYRREIAALRGQGGISVVRSYHDHHCIPM